MSRPSAADAEAVRALDGDLLILGAGGKMGPTLARRAARACPERPVVAVSRSQHDVEGVTWIQADLLADLAGLPDAENVLFLAGRKFGSAGNPGETWATNAVLPAKVCERWAGARFVVLSSGNVYPLSPPTGGGATEQMAMDPLGEYAQSVRARERVFEHYASPAVFLRLNYAVEMRYGVLLDIGMKVFERRPIDLGMGCFNCIWQGDANSVCLRAFGLAAVPAGVLNLTGPETVSVRQVAARFGELFGVAPVFEGAEGHMALLSNAAKCTRLFGYPTVCVDQAIEWTAQWIGMGGEMLGKATHFEVTDGKY